MPDSPTVSLVVLNWNGKRYLASCLQSLAELDYPAERLELILCDNGSRDGSVEFVKQQFPRVRVVELDRNHGFAQGNNLAAKQATGEWVGFLNNDMKVDRAWLASMLAVRDEKPDVACIASKIVNWDGSLIDFVGGGINFMGQGFQLDYAKRSSPDDKFRRLLFACGGAMLIKRELFLEVGGFDPDYFAYFEDVDLGWRLNIFGYDVWYTPHAIVYHHHHSSGRKIPQAKLRTLYERNALATIFKCYDDENLAVAFPDALLLLNERALRMSHLNIQSFTFGDVPGSNTERDEKVERASRASKALRVWREQGPGIFFQKVLVRLTIALIDGLVYWLHAIGDQRFWLTGVSISHYVALSQFAHELESLKQKRASIQSRRRRSDAEIIPLFIDPFYPGYPDEHYLRFFKWLTRVEGLDQRFAAQPAAQRIPVTKNSAGG
jgi:GT2 family glycosyltransferase